MRLLPGTVWMCFLSFIPREFLLATLGSFLSGGKGWALTSPGCLRNYDFVNIRLPQRREQIKFSFCTFCFFLDKTRKLFPSLGNLHMKTQLPEVCKGRKGSQWGPTGGRVARFQGVVSRYRPQECCLSDCLDCSISRFYHLS